MVEPKPQILYRVAIRDDSDVGAARRRAREVAERSGLSSAGVEALATAVSEIARNIVVHAGSGHLSLGLLEHVEHPAVVAIAVDDGPGIPSAADALRDGYSTGDGLGLGLPGARRLVDEFELESVVGRGTTVTLRKWIPPR